MRLTQFLSNMMQEGTVIGLLLVAISAIVIDLTKHLSTDQRLVFLWLGRVCLVLGSAAIIITALRAANLFS
jgi:hypothetical protein